MTLRWACEIAGVLLAVLGGVIGVRGFVLTWGEFSPHRRLTQDERDRMRGVGRKIIGVIRTFADSALDMWRVFVGSSPEVTLGSSVGLAPSEAHKLIRAPIDTSKPLADVVRALQEQDQEKLDQLREQMGSLEAKITEVAVGGLKLQVVGLLLVTVGTLLAALPALAYDSPWHHS
ncbi:MULTISPECIES: hypothetical protein [Streptomycetaceae]|uniref:Uncharacterized protein n=1 Tax=Kitasatospora atroaurantiaca TaxID=285545 RepID=A0A561ESP0_9ACTN|nr:MULTISPECIES: hypothetical protein [Streptomycetaceae]TWE18624.1 hypothetical protein FB465_3705 [Kitasatospora atroaurantiaca]GGT46107.1 hypothetical protein GCM10010254_75880 [Streptomyces chromofuscus]